MDLLDLGSLFEVAIMVQTAIEEVSLNMVGSLDLDSFTSVWS